MSDIADGDTQQDPVVAGDDGSGGNPPGGALCPWSEDNHPVAGGGNRVLSLPSVR